MKEQYPIFELTEEEVHKAQSIYGLVQRGVAEGKLKPRSFRDIAENIHTFTTYSHEDKIIACGALELNETTGYIRSIYVDRQFRGQRIAATLTNRLIRQAEDAGMKEVTLNTHNSAIFHSNGFERDDTPKGMTLVL